MKKVLSVSQMVDAENKIFASGVTQLELMQRAVNGIFSFLPDAKRTLVVVGFGNNGGDGLGLSVKLYKSGRDVEILLLSKKQKPCGECFYNQCKQLGIKIHFFDNNFDFSGYDQIVDCIFGIGFHGELDEETIKVVEKINESSAFVVSVDIPSGLNGDTGLCLTAVKSQLTISVGALKYGNLLGMAKDYIKELKVCDIGIDNNSSVMLFDEVSAKEMIVKRNNFSHKGDYGYVGVLAGCKKYSGAAKLANLSMASMRCGAGVARLIIPDCIEKSVMPYLTVSTLFTLPSVTGGVKFDEESLENALSRLDALSFGMGLDCTDETVKILEYILKNHSLKLVVDADGINALCKIDKSVLKNTKCTVVLTPHIKELSRLSGYSKKEILSDTVGIAKRLAKLYNATVLIKGCATVVADENECYIVNSGAPGMATAGSGDVLSGALTGVLGWNTVCAKSVSFGAYVCGKAGEIASNRVGDIGMTAIDTVNCLPNALKDLEN